MAADEAAASSSGAGGGTASTSTSGAAVGGAGGAAGGSGAAQGNLAGPQQQQSGTSAGSAPSGSGAAGGSGKGVTGGGGTTGGTLGPSTSGKGAAGGSKNSKVTSKGAGPAQNTRSHKGKGTPAQQKNPKSVPPMSAEEDAIAALLQRGHLLAQVAGDRAAAANPDLLALQDDLVTAQNAIDEINHLDFQDVSAAHEHLVTEAIEVRAALTAMEKVLRTRADALKVSTPAGTLVGAPTPPTSKTGSKTTRGNRSTSRSRKGQQNAKGGLPRRLLGLAHSRSQSGSGRTSPATGANLASLGGASSTGGAAPSWSSSRRHPFDPNNCNMGDDWYLDLPFPWNALPQKGNLTATEVYRMASTSLPKFDGSQGAYDAWRSCFIPCVHLTNIDVSYKTLLLRASLEPRTARMREFVNSIVGSKDGYKLAIETLEKRYGGQDALLLARQEALMAVPELREGDYRVVEMLHSRLSTFLLEWSGVNGEEIDETESLAFYTLVMSKVESTFTLRYLDWLRQQQARRGLQSLRDWLGEQLDDHRQVETYHRRRAVSLRAAQRELQSQQGQGGQQPPQRRRSLPPHQLDRNFAPQRGFLTLEEEWEAADGAVGADGGVDEADELVDQVFLVPQAASSHSNTQQRGKPFCPICKTSHPLAKCAKFQELSPRQRKDLLIKDARCFLCFQKTHPVTKCRFRYMCVRCGGRHHTMIHGADEQPQQQQLLANDDGDADYEGAGELVEFGLVAAAGASGGGDRARVSLRTITLRMKNPVTGKAVAVNALLDDGCTVGGILCADKAEELGLTGPPYWTTTEGIGGKVVQYKTFLSQVEVRALQGGSYFRLGVQIMQRPAGTYTPIDWSLHQQEFEHLKDLPVAPPLAGQGVHLLVGSKVPFLSAALEERRGEEREPVARRTPLGWTITGPTRSLSSDKSAAIAALLTSSLEAVPLLAEERGKSQDSALLQVRGQKLVPAQDEVTDRQLHKMVQRLLREESVPEVEVLSPREEFIVKQARSELKIRDGRYQVGCTWAPSASRPHLNLPQAHNRLRSLEASKHFANQQVRQAYQAVVDAWKEGGEVAVVPHPSDEVKYLLPHFPIVNLEKTSTPVRVVMDCKVELNKYLLAGPNLLNEVPAVLLRFRSGLYTFSGDVKKMFLRIFLPPEDRPFHCFLWRDKDGNIEVLQFQVHVFGNAGSPFLAVFVVQEHARKYKNQFPAAVDTICRSTLIDDVLDSADTVDEARSLLHRVREILRGAGMEMAKFHSNSEAVLQGIEREARAGATIEVSQLGTAADVGEIKTLGLCYDARKDLFFFRTPAVPTLPWTKRRVLKLFPRLYDPLGFLLPYSIRARIYFSSIAGKERPWDEILPEAEGWTAWVKQLPELDAVRFPRCLKRDLHKAAALHVFADASAEAFAAAAYLVCSYESGPPTSCLVAAKAHVAPRKSTTIPRLELLAAELSLAVRKMALKHLKIEPERVFHWSDSITVLYWLNNDAKRFQLFVHNKLQHIRRESALAEWKWVPTLLNPADLPTRGTTPRSLQDSTLWKSGPPFLLQEEALWPRPPALIPTSGVLQELRKAEQVGLLVGGTPASSPLLLHPGRCSSLRRLFKPHEALLRWRDRARLRLALPPIGRVRERVERFYIYHAQQSIREALFSSSPKGKLKEMGFYVLPPFLAADGLVRGKGRLQQAVELPHDFREPILLPKGHPLTSLLLQEAHSGLQRHGHRKRHYPPSACHH